MIAVIRNICYNQRLKDLKLICVVQKNLGSVLIPERTHHSWCKMADSRAKLFAKHFSTSVAQYFYKLKLEQLELLWHVQF